MGVHHHARPHFTGICNAATVLMVLPIATPATMMGPGGHRFGDYWKFGLVTLIVRLGVALLVIPLVWPFA